MIKFREFFRWIFQRNTLDKKMSINISESHIQQLISIESGVKYNESPPFGEHPFIAIARESCVMLSAPHGTRTFRNNGKDSWHEEDEYTAGMALLLSELCGTSVIANVWRSDKYDPNYHKKCEYKEQMKDLIVRKKIRFVLDLHGAAQDSPKMDTDKTIDLGYRSENDEERSIDEVHIAKLESLLAVSDDSCDPACFKISRNKFAARGSETREPITSFVYHLNLEKRVQAVQIEMKPQTRIAKRLPTASLFKSRGDYAADPRCIIHTIQALAEYIAYLQNIDHGI